MKVKISFIIPAYNVEKYIGKCVDSIINQDYSEYEIIVINDGSTDRTSEILEKKYSHNDKITIINNNNNGVSISRNVGLAKANGDYIYFIDADDYIEEKKIESIVETLEKTGADVFEFGYSDVNNEKKIINKKKNKDITDKKKIMKLFFKKKISISLWNKVFSKNIIDSILFDEKISHYEDKVFIYYVLKRSKKFVSRDIVVYNHVKRTNSLSSETFKLSYFKDLMYSDKIILYDCETDYKQCSKVFFVDDCLEMIKMITKSGEKEKYVQEVEKLKNNIHSLDIKSFLKLKMKRKIEVALIVWFPNIYDRLFEKKEGI